MQTWTAPHTGVYQLEVFGAQGEGNGGLGGKSQATYNLNKGDNLYIRVGGQNGFNGGGAGLQKGGGATDIRLNGESLSQRLLVGAGGGGKSGGTNGGSDNGAGGASVGAGAGSNGVDGGGGGSSYDYTYETGYNQETGYDRTLGYWQDTGYSQDTGYWDDIGYWDETGYWDTYSYCESPDKEYYHEGIWITETGCSDANNYHEGTRWVKTGEVWVSTGSKWVKTGTEWVDTGEEWVTTGYEWVHTGYQWIHTGYETAYGNPGKGGSNYIASGSNQLKQTGVRSGNGYASITQLNQLPILTINTPTNYQLVLPNTTIPISGTVKDDDNRGTVNISYQIDSRPKVNIGDFPGLNTPQNYSIDMFIPANEIVGNHTLKVIATDSEGGVTEKTITIEVKDIYNPVLTLSQNITASTNQSVLITATATDNHQVKRIKLPNGNYVSGGATTYTAEGNGTYVFIAEDFYGNIDTKSVTIQNIDKGLPNPPTVTVDENWTNQSRTVSMQDNGDNGFSGVDRIEYRLSGASSKGWTVYNSSFSINTEGITTIESRVIDKVGNSSSIVTKTVRIDKSNPKLVVTSNIQGLINTDIILTAVATDTLSGVKRIQLPNGNWVNASTTSYTVGENGSYQFKAEDNLGHITTLTFEVKNIKKNVLITPIRDVDLELNADDLYSGVTHMRFKNEDGAWSSWENYSTYKAWLVSPVDGLKHVWVQYKDKVGNIGEAIEDIIILDTTKPTATFFQINDDETYTNTRSVTLNVKGTDSLTGMKEILISNDNKTWETFDYTEEDIDWILSNGDGIKTVYVKVVDEAGNASNPITDTIFLDTTKPLSNIVINNGDAYSATRDVNLKLTYSDVNGSGVETVKVIEGDREYTLPKPTANSPITIPWTLDFGVVRTVSIVVTDKAGNVSNIVSDSIIVDKLTINQFTLEEVVNPLEFSKKKPFEPKVWAFEPQPMISGGNITFSIDIKKAVEPNVVTDSVAYKVEIVGEGGYHKALTGQMRKSVDHYTQTVTIPTDAPNGAKVYVTATAKRVLSVSPFDTQIVYFPGGEDISQKAYIGEVQGNIYDAIRFNETN